jgi:metallophosphoesterase (TIGR00282 family)
MRILFLGDVVGRSGRDALLKYLPEVKAQTKPDVIIVNGENACHGSGITDKACKEFYQAGVNIITLGNHSWGQKELIFTIDKDPNIIRPINYPETSPGKGSLIYTLSDGRKLLVANALGRVFMEPLDCPFVALNKLIERYPLGSAVQASFIDFHGEATSEKMAAAQYFDGRVSAVIGTHTHLPTADCLIFDKGTAFQADAGMTGDYNSVIGVKSDVPVARFVRKMPTDRMQPAEGDGTVSGTLILTDDKTGKALNIARVCMGPRLANTMPSF